MISVDRLLQRFLAGPVEEAVRRALEQHRDREPHLSPDALLERYAVWGDKAKLHLHPTAVVNNALFNLSSGEITVGEHAFFGHNVVVLTGTHDVNKFGAERKQAIAQEGYDVVIEEGVWLSSNVIVVGPCRIGAHAVVGVGSLVREDVEPYTIVAGSPAKVIREIEHDDDQGPGGETGGDGEGGNSEGGSSDGSSG